MKSDPRPSIDLALEIPRFSGRCVVNPTFDDRYAEWAAAEAAVLLASQSPGTDMDRLSALCAEAAEKHRLLWAQPDGLPE